MAMRGGRCAGSRQPSGGTSRPIGCSRVHDRRFTGSRSLELFRLVECRAVQARRLVQLMRGALGSIR
jgi:hypothetical protein